MFCITYHCKMLNLWAIFRSPYGLIFHIYCFLISDNQFTHQHVIVQAIFVIYEFVFQT